MARPPQIPQPLKFELGLKQTGNKVDLNVAGLKAADLGGVYIESAKGLGVDLDGKLSGLETTPTTIGMLFDAPYDGKTYNRLNGKWEESSIVPPGTLPIANYVDTGVVSIVPNRALRIEPTGALDVLPASPTQLGVILDPPFDSGKPDVTYVRKWGDWVENTTILPNLAVELIIPNMAPVGSAPITVSVHGTKFTATTTVIVDGAAKATIYVSPTELSFQIDPTLETIRTASVTVQDTVGPVNGLGDAKFNFVANTNLYRGLYSPVNNSPDIWAGRQLNYMWIVNLADPMVPEFSGVPGLANIPLNEGDHLVYDGTQYNVVDGNQTQSLYQGWWKVATNVPDIGTMTKYIGYMWIADTAIPNTPETPPLGLPGLDGVAIYEGDMILWDGVKFVLMQGVLTPNYRGLWNVASNTPDIANPPVGNNKPNWMWIAKTVDPNVPERVPVGVPGITGMLIREGDHIVWDKPNSVFIKVSGNGAGNDFGIGLATSPGADPGDPQIVNLTAAGDSPATLGGVYVIDRVRNNTEGLELGLDGRLRVPPATDSLLGGMLEPPLDDKGYVRTYKGGVGMWVPPALPPSSVTIADAPPPGAVHGDTWWESDTGKYYIRFDDGNSQQWVQISGGGGGTYNITGVAEAPLDGQSYARRGSDASWQLLPVGTFVDAPNDGKQYGRQSLTWTEVTGGTFVDAPSDNKTYGRKNATWSEVAGALPIVPVADAFPASPVQGQLHFLSTDASLYIWFVDASSVGSWVEVSAL